MIKLLHFSLLRDFSHALNFFRGHRGSLFDPSQ